VPSHATKCSVFSFGQTMRHRLLAANSPKYKIPLFSASDWLPSTKLITLLSSYIYSPYKWTLFLWQDPLRALLVTVTVIIGSIVENAFLSPVCLVTLPSARCAHMLYPPSQISFYYFISVIDKGLAVVALSKGMYVIPSMASTAPHRVSLICQTMRCVYEVDGSR
jgi:hypothetical protein